MQGVFLFLLKYLRLKSGSKSDILKRVLIARTNVFDKRTYKMRQARLQEGKIMKKRILSVLLAAAMLSAMLAGCEKNDETVSLYQNADDCSAATGKAAEYPFG